jgi:hypothetical protein
LPAQISSRIPAFHLVASGAGVGTQVIAAIVFVVTLLAIIEIALISYLATPAKTQAVVERLHDWALTNRRKNLRSDVHSGWGLTGGRRRLQQVSLTALPQRPIRFESGTVVALRRRDILVPQHR